MHFNILLYKLVTKLDLKKYWVIRIYFFKSKIFVSDANREAMQFSGAMVVLI